MLQKPQQSGSSALVSSPESLWWLGILIPLAALLVAVPIVTLIIFQRRRRRRSAASPVSLELRDTSSLPKVVSFMSFTLKMVGRTCICRTLKSRNELGEDSLE